MRRPRSPSGGLVPVPAWGEFSSANFLYQADEGGGIRGRDGAWWFGAVFLLPALPTGFGRIAACGSVAGSRGWHIWIDSGGTVTVRMYDAGGTPRDANPAGLVIGEWNALWCRGTGAQVQASLNDGAWGAAACADYAPPLGADPMRVGQRANGSNQPLQGYIAGCGGSDTYSPDAGQSTAWFAAVKTALQSGVGWANYDATESEHVWIAPSLADVGSTGDADLTEFGTVPVAQIVAPWAW